VSATEKPTSLEALDPRYPLLAEYFERGWWLIKLHGVAETSTAEHPVCLCRDGAECSAPGKKNHGTYAKAEGTAYVRSLEEAVTKLPPGKRWNVGHAFGYGSGADEVALDIESDAALEQIRSEYGFDPLLAGAWARTGRGYHALYRLTPEQLEQKATLGMGQGAGEWAVPHVDIRVGGTNGYIVIEPSVHYSGRAYKWQELGELTEPPAGFLALMATRKNLQVEEKPAQETKPKPKASNVIELGTAFEKRDHSRHRAEKLLETVCAKVTAASSNRNEAVSKAAYALGGSLYLWPEGEQASYREKLKDAAAVQTPQGDRDYAERRHTVEESWKAGAAKGSSDPIPPPGSDAPRSSSSTPPSAPPTHDTGEESEEESFRPGVRWKRLSEIGLPQPVEWLEGDIAEGRIPRGELTIIMGEPGVGKGSITAQIVAEVTNAGGVVIISAPEDSLESVTLPRYMAAGAVLENVITVGYAWEDDEPWTPLDIAEHHSQLLAIASETGGKLIVLDPLEEHLTADAKSERETRLALRHLLSGCRAIGCAVLGIDHVNRMASSSGYKRAGGSSAKYKIARSVLIAGRQGSTGEENDPAEQSLKPRTVALIPDKLNVGAAARGLRFELLTEYVAGAGGTQVSTAVARLLGETTLTSEELLGEQAQESRETVSACAEWLLDYLTRHGLGHLQAETRKDARDTNADWKPEILELAVKQLGGKHAPLGMGGSWGYRLPGYIPTGADRH
jgi:hypothetical protein